LLAKRKWTTFCKPQLAATGVTGRLFYKESTTTMDGGSAGKCKEHFQHQLNTFDKNQHSTQSFFLYLEFQAQKSLFL
jgi:hypothetical protein